MSGPRISSVIRTFICVPRKGQMSISCPTLYKSLKRFFKAVHSSPHPLVSDLVDSGLESQMVRPNHFLENFYK